MAAQNKGVLVAATARTLAPYVENAIFNRQNVNKVASTSTQRELVEA
jgi:hypothetical protein